MVKKGVLRASTSFLDIFKMADLFGEKVSFKIANRRTFPSVFGTLVSLAIFAFMLMYGLQKFTVM